MTVSTVVDHNDYVGNGVTTSFPYTFRIFKKTDLVVTVIDLDENLTVLTLDSDYTVTNAGSYTGGNVILPAALATGWQISIARELEATQETDLRNQGKFFAEVHEDAFDKLTMLVQQTYSAIRLALRKPSTIANWYDALNNYIRNVRDPRDPQDAATKNYVDTLADSNLSRTLRVPEPIPQLPDAASRANKMPAFDSAGDPIVVLPPSGTASDVLIELAKTTGGNLVGLKKTGLPNNLATTVGAYYQTTAINAVNDYGMKPDFDPTTGVANGTNNRAALQRLMDDLVSIGGNKTVIIPPGNYYFNFDGSTNPGGVGVMWGRVGAGLKNVTFLCYGASFYSGSVGRFNGIFSANYGVNIIGLRVVGFGAGPLAVARERDSCFSLAYNCNGVTFDSCYLCNTMGDCIYLGGSLEDGLITGLFCRDIVIKNCILKERYGNGVRSYFSGTRSRLVVAIIDCVGLIISDNTIVGGLDFEPNAGNQRLQNIIVRDNHFHIGNYLAYTGSSPFVEEIFNSGTQVIRGDIRFQTVAGGVITQNIQISDNDFDYGYLRQTQLAINDVVWTNNRMFRGVMALGHDSGSNSNPGARIDGLYIDLPLNGSDDDIGEIKTTVGGSVPSVPSVAIIIQGNLTLANLRNILVAKTTAAMSYLFYADPTHTAGDSGRCVYENCKILGGSTFNYSLPDTSHKTNITVMPNTGVAISEYRRISADLVLTAVGALSISSSGSLDWNTFRTSKLALTATVAGLQVSGINNAPQIGAEVQIRNAGTTNSIILANSASFYLKGAASATLDDTRKVVTMQYISPGVWSEIYRNF